MSKIKLLILFFTLGSPLFSQDVAIGQWKEHLSYSRGLSITEGNNKVYCATKSGIFSYNKGDNSLQRMSKVSGLSDVQAVEINFNKFNNKLIIAYLNSNIDIIDKTGITNISDIKRKNIIGNKSINNTYFINQYAYLSCGFGIVVLDMNKNEVSDTYYIGPNGSSINVNDITSDGTYIYAATDAGVYKGLINDNLANYNAWSKVTNLPNGKYNCITSFSGKMFTNFSSNSANADTVFYWDINSLSKLSQSIGNTTSGLKNNHNKLLMIQSDSITYFDNTLLVNGVYNGYYWNNYAMDAVMDDNGTLWIADKNFGMINWSPGVFLQYRYPNGPATESVFEMSLEGDNLWVVPGAINSFWGNFYNIDGLFNYSNSTWTNLIGNQPLVDLGSFFDVLNVLVSPIDNKRVYAASWGRGVLEIYDGVAQKVYNASNSSLQHNDGTDVRTYGLAIDANDNLWVSNSETQGIKCLSIKSSNGSWRSLNFSNVLSSSILDFGHILIDKNNQKWVILPRGNGLMVYKGAVTDNPDISNTKKLETNIGKGALPSSNVSSIAEDKDGQIWIGTDKGIAVFYSPENVFTGQNFDAQQILITQDGHVQILLETETVQCIAVDDANRKWIGTANSGVFLMSSDGTQQLLHFNDSNSPLFSNDVKSIKINHITGEVYFGTSKGLLSYRGTAIEGFEECTDLYTFPNPVKHEYSGPIAIKGVMNTATIKITDVSGAFVYETKSEGGQAIWYGKNFKGDRVNTGVYFVFCTSEDGSQKCMTKILVIN